MTAVLARRDHYKFCGNTERGLAALRQRMRQVMFACLQKEGERERVPSFFIGERTLAVGTTMTNGAESAQIYLEADRLAK